MDILQGLSIDYGNDIWVFYQRVGRGMVANEVVLNSVGPEHDVNGRNMGWNLVVLNRAELIVFSNMGLCFGCVLNSVHGICYRDLLGCSLELNHKILLCVTYKDWKISPC